MHHSTMDQCVIGLHRPVAKRGLLAPPSRSVWVTFASILRSIRAVASVSPGSIVWSVCLYGVTMTLTFDGRVAFQLLAEEKTLMSRRNDAIANLLPVQGSLVSKLSTNAEVRQ